MTILDSKVLTKGGPFIEFASVPKYLVIDENAWPSQEQYGDHVFFSWADSLTELVCTVAHSYIFWDIHAFIQHRTPEKIYGFSADMLLLTSRVAACPLLYFDQYNFYENTNIPESQRTASHLKADLLETLLSVINNIIQTARDGRCLAIVGI